MFEMSGYLKLKKDELLGGRGTVGVSGRDVGFGVSVGILVGVLYSVASGLRLDMGLCIRISAVATSLTLPRVVRGGRIGRSLRLRVS